MSRVLLIFSGGMDSSTLLWELLSNGDDVDAITFDYGQRHSAEILYAKDMIKYLNEQDLDVRHDIIDVKPIFRYIDSSALTNNDIQVPNCGYTEESAKITVVPNRNQILLSIAVGIAASRGISTVMYAAHNGDSAIYPDCRPVFLDALNEATRISTLWHPVKIEAPFIHLTKSDIVKIGLHLGVPFEITRSCYNTGDTPCGTCPTCIERIEAFTLNNTVDPVVYLPH
jgi:7-cyano-7-deazaguanine synthase